MLLQAISARSFRPAGESSNIGYAVLENRVTAAAHCFGDSRGSGIGIFFLPFPAGWVAIPIDMTASVVSVNRPGIGDCSFP